MELILGQKVTLADLIGVARFGWRVSFSEQYENRVKRARKLVQDWVDEKRVMYGITTGFGALCTQTISKENAEKLQYNIVISHSTSVGEPMSPEQVRAVMLMVLQNVGQGYCGARLETMILYKDMLNKNIIPYAPKEGSVGYLSPEAHIALTAIGEGRAYYHGELMDSKTALEKSGLSPIKLSFKEGLILTSGTTSPTALGALALFDMLKAAKTADIIGAMSLEILKGTTKAYDERLAKVRPHQDQAKTAENIRRILADSEISKQFVNFRLQDALSLRSMAQAHGAAKKTLEDAKVTFEIEMNACTDNPILWTGDQNTEAEALSGCNCDSGYVGIEMDSAAIAGTYIAKMSERRNNRLINGNLSGYPMFLIKTPGLNSGLMIPQYTQAGLLNDMKILSHPATVDCIPTCSDQEDYVAMGYNACKKAGQIAEKLEYILAIELLSVYQAHHFFEEPYKPGISSTAVLNELKKTVPALENDILLYPHIEHIRQLIHQGKIIELVEDQIGKLN